MSDAAIQLAVKIRETLGEALVVSDPADIAPWLTDWRGRWTGKSAAILQPSTREEVAAIVAMALEAGVPLVPQGGNTSMVGGATSPEDGRALILSLRRLNRIRRIDSGARRAIVEAGVILQTLHEAAAGEGLRFPLTLGARGSCTIGGLISTNAGGTQVLRHGTMRALVEGVEAILPDGTLHDGLTGLKKDNRGLSLDQLLIGAEGTMGIITAARLKLVPAIAERGVAWIGLDSPQRALDVLRALEKDTDRVEGFEILPDESLVAALAEIEGARPPLQGRHRWHALIEAVSDSAEEESPAALLARLLEPLLASGIIGDAAIASSEAQAEAFWRIRDGLSGAEKRHYGPATQHDIAVQVERMPAFLDEAAAAVEKAFPGTHASGFGHLGDGNIHFHVRSPKGAQADWVAKVGPDVSRLVHDLVAAAGGSISAEHGIGQMKREELERLDPARVATLRALKQALDPGALFNPGKLV